MNHLLATDGLAEPQRAQAGIAASLTIDAHFGALVREAARFLATDGAELPLRLTPVV